MKNNTGMSRKVDELGRIVIPKEIRNKFDIKTNDRLDIYVENDVISLMKDSKKCIFCTYIEKICRILILKINLFIWAKIFKYQSSTKRRKR